MINIHSQLEKLLAIPDKEDRFKALLRYAQSLGGNILTGQPLTEEKLVILIYERLSLKEQNVFRSINPLVSGFLAGIMCIVLLTVIFVLAKKIYENKFLGSIHAITARPDASTQVFVNGIFPLVDGTYNYFSEDGYMLYEYVFISGRLRVRREFDTTGNVLLEQIFSDNE